MREGNSLRPRVGHIQFLNCLPLYYGLVKNQVLLDVELSKGTPTELNKMLIEGQLDISPISSFEYAKNHRKLDLLPGITVSSDGDVKSIYLISKLPIEELDCKKIALTNTSASSVNLLKIILKDKYDINPEYFVCPPNLPSMLMEAEAALLIGDSAMRAFCQSRDNLLFYDLGAQWKALTGHKMVYAVWAVRKEFSIKNPQLVKEIFNGFYRSMRYSVDNVDKITKDACRWETFDYQYLKDYFLSLEYNFNNQHQEGLMEYYRRLYQRGILTELPQLKFVEV